MERFKVPDDQPMGRSPNQIENAQKKVEAELSRGRRIKYDDVLNKQRTVIDQKRRRVLEGEDLSRRSASGSTR
jgi:preprotein translocase subunit SecA